MHRDESYSNNVMLTTVNDARTVTVMHINRKQRVYVVSFGDLSRNFNMHLHHIVHEQDLIYNSAKLRGNRLPVPTLSPGCDRQWDVTLICAL